MKVFQWAHSRSGGIWEDLLTDTDGQYVELQSGRLFNQAASNSAFTPFKHFGFEPYGMDVFREYWFPILQTKGVKKANPTGVLMLRKREICRSFTFARYRILMRISMSILVKTERANPCDPGCFADLVKKVICQHIE
jgi:hypothetical protein